MKRSTWNYLNIVGWNWNSKHERESLKLRIKEQLIKDEKIIDIWGMKRQWTSLEWEGLLNTFCIDEVELKESKKSFQLFPFALVSSIHSRYLFNVLNTHRIDHFVTAAASSFARYRPISISLLSHCFKWTTESHHIHIWRGYDEMMRDRANFFSHITRVDSRQIRFLCASPGCSFQAPNPTEKTENRNVFRKIEKHFYTQKTNHVINATWKHVTL